MREFGLRTLLILTIGLLALGTLAPVAAAEPNGFGRCWLEQEEVGYFEDPDGNMYPVYVTRIECAW